MRTLKKMISRYMYQVTWVLAAIMLVIVFYLQIYDEQKRAYENATRTFLQLEQILEANQKELEEIQQEYRQTCLHNAEVVARIIESDPDILNSVEELREVAAAVEIDEIHIFDETGCIFTGTHPEYYNFTFDSGEQMEFFKPMLEDKTLKLVQEITPNTAEEKMMQYAAVWSSNGEFIVQVGIKPVNVMQVTEKNELSYLFSLFRVNPEANYYAINAESGKIVGSTDLDSVGKDLGEIGFSFHDIKSKKNGFHTKLNGQSSFCIFRKMGDNYIGRVVVSNILYQRIPATTLVFFLCFVAIAFCLAKAVTKYMNKYVVDKIQDVNKKLGSIADGNLEETVNIESSKEFFELSNYINTMVNNLLNYNKKMSYVLSKTNLYIGIYEYNHSKEKVRCTEYMAKILAVEEEQMEQMSASVKKFEEFLDKVRENPVSEEPGVFKVCTNPEQYARLEEMKNDNDEVFGVALDVTEEIKKRKKIEAERDTDVLTGLYNRHGLDIRLSRLFDNPEQLGCSAMVMLDADGLKGINDTYGHEMGDVYLKKISEIINNFGRKNSVVARQGGDEFVLFLYGYGNKEELMKTLETLEHAQKHTSASLSEDLQVPLRFSFGYCLMNGSSDYQQVLKEADEKMYENKESRKREKEERHNGKICGH